MTIKASEILKFILISKTWITIQNPGKTRSGNVHLITEYFFKNP
jgi:hypothetical protein